MSEENMRAAMLCQLCGKPEEAHGLGSVCPKFTVEPTGESLSLLCHRLEKGPITPKLADEAALRIRQLRKLLPLYEYITRAWLAEGYELIDAAEFPELAIKAGLMVRMAYDPEAHDIFGDAEEGDEIFLLNDDARDLLQMCKAAGELDGK